VSDVDIVVQNVGEAGGKVVFGPMDVMSAGRMAIFTDPTGAFIAAWQPGEHLGAQVVNDPGSLIWNELATSDLAKAKAFYAAVFGWGWGGSADYAEAQVSGRSVAGVRPRGSDMPVEIPDHWLVYFGTADLDADTAKAQELGGTVLVPVTEIPGTGRFAVVADPQGASFGLFAG
jgi:predicted enzyme related to lactoylglutathione lyase